MGVIIDKAAMRRRLAGMLRSTLALSEVAWVKVRDSKMLSADDEQAISGAIDACWHDAFSDIDIKIAITLNPQDVTAYRMPQNISRFGFKSGDVLGVSINGDADNIIYRIVLEDGIRFDIGVSIAEDAGKPAQGISYAAPAAIKDKGRFWPRMNLNDANNFWFVQVMALGKLMRGDYLIADHLANMQINETLVLQMIARDDAKSTNIHRYGGREMLEYRAEAVDKLPFSASDETARAIAGKLYAAANAYDKLAAGLNPEYAARAAKFFDIWRFYDGVSMGKNLDKAIIQIKLDGR